MAAYVFNLCVSVRLSYLAHVAATPLPTLSLASLLTTLLLLLLLLLLFGLSWGRCATWHCIGVAGLVAGSVRVVLAKLFKKSVQLVHAQPVPVGRCRFAKLCRPWHVCKAHHRYNTKQQHRNPPQLNSAPLSYHASVHVHVAGVAAYELYILLTHRWLVTESNERTWDVMGFQMQLRQARGQCHELPRNNAL